MTFSDPIEKWLAAFFKDHPDDCPKVQAYRAAFEDFLAFSGKTAPQIITEYSRDSLRQFKAAYGKLLLNYTAYLQKELAPHEVKERVDVVRSFFGYYGLPLGFGVRAHLQFFFK